MAYLKKSKRDPTILNLIMRQPMTANWTGNDYKPFKTITLDPRSGEYTTVKEKFNRSSPNCVINRIERVENPFLLGQYLLKREKMKKKTTVTEISLFHGTRRANARGICRYNFDWRRNGRSRGCKFGQGVSFTPQASYARHYTFNENVFILAKVLIGRSITGSAQTKIPKSGYDTTRNPQRTVYVKYEDDDFYPEYLITCRSG